jgi:hypothetical protein
MALASSSRYGNEIDWAVLHSAEGARTVQSLFDFFNRNQNASSHAGADGYQLSGDWVPDERAAWTLLDGNPRSLNLELCGFAHWTREQWLSEGSVDGVWNPRQMIRNAATWTRRKCETRNLPKRWLTLDQIRRGERGILMHADYTYATGDGDHTDLGKNFPKDVFMSDVNGAEDMQADEREWLRQLYEAFSKPYVQNGVDVGDVLARLGRLFPDLDLAVMEKFGTLNPGDLTNATVSAYSLLYKYIWPFLEQMQKQLDAVATAVLDGNGDQAAQMLAAVRTGLNELLSAHVSADVSVTLNPRESDGPAILTGEVLAIDAAPADQ